MSLGMFFHFAGPTRAFRGFTFDILFFDNSELIKLFSFDTVLPIKKCILLRLVSNHSMVNTQCSELANGQW